MRIGKLIMMIGHVVRMTENDMRKSQKEADRVILPAATAAKHRHTNTSAIGSRRPLSFLRNHASSNRGLFLNQTNPLSSPSLPFLSFYHHLHNIRREYQSLTRL